jgi:hypothetical protein
MQYHWDIHLKRYKAKIKPAVKAGFIFYSEQINYPTYAGHPTNASFAISAPLA